MEGLTFGSQEVLPETRGGFPIYSGSPARYSEWHFKVNNRVRVAQTTADKAVRKEKMATLIAQVIDALEGEALKEAMDMSEEELSKDDAIKELCRRIEALSARHKKDEARELHRIGAKRGGPMSRQPTEPVTSYVARYKRWYKR